jgi:hypothetical protein
MGHMFNQFALDKVLKYINKCIMSRDNHFDTLNFMVEEKSYFCPLSSVF